MISPKEVREILEIGNGVPIYFMDEDLLLEATKEFHDEIKLKDTQENQAKGAIGLLKEYNQYRPFDEVVLVSSNRIIVHFSDHEIPRTFFLEGDIWKNTTIRDNFVLGNFDPSTDLKTLNFNAIYAATLLYPFSQKKSVINLCTLRTTYKGKTGKIKAKKSNVAIISNKIYNYENSKGTKVYKSFQCTKVAGHRRFYRKKPDTKGHDRYGNEVVGWTWVSPYKRGEGKEIAETIRKFVSR
jgi:hypothetical protein